MNKKTATIIKLLAVSFMAVAISGCGHEHQWVDATCTEPRTCSECGKTEGEPLGHTWVDATCTEPKTCKVCGATEGEALGHDFTEATCTTSKTCKRCGATQGDPLGHNVTDWTITREPTCTNKGSRKGTCSVCGESVVEILDETGHDFSGEWEVVEEATFSSPGKKVMKCPICGKEIKSQSFEISDEEKEDFSISIEGDHFDCTVDDFIENFKYRNHGSFTFTKFQADDESQAYIFTAGGKLKCTVLCTKTDEGKLKGILVNSDDYTGSVAVGMLMANTIDDYFNPEDEETSDEIANKLLSGGSVEHDGLVVASYDTNSGPSIIIVSNN